MWVAVIGFKVALSCIHISTGCLLLPPLKHPAVWSINVRCCACRTESELLPSSCSKSAGREERSNDCSDERVLKTGAAFEESHCLRMGMVVKRQQLKADQLETTEATRG